jgi:phospholipid/cholesterol/gamma-HCH transport system substrate-binding protein
MSELTRKNIKLGLFALIGVLIFVVAIYYVGAQQGLFRSTVSVSAYFKNVGGLQVGNNVRYAGINIGTVKGISIISDSKILVSMDIDRNASKFIKSDAEVSIGSEGLMGNKAASISSGTEGVSVSDGDVLTGIEPMEIDQILVELEKTGKHAQKIMINLEEITNYIKQGEGTIGRLLTDEGLVENFDHMVKAYSETGDNMRHFSNRLSKISDQLQSGEGALGKLMMDTAIATQFENAVKSLESTVDNTANVTSNMVEFTEKLNNNNGTLGKLLNDSIMAENVEQSILNIRRGSDDLEVTIQRINNSWLLNLFSKKDKEIKNSSEALR